MLGTPNFEPRSFAESTGALSRSSPGVGDRRDNAALSGLAAGGRLTVISLAAVRTRLGSSWPQRRERVWEAVDRQLSRRLQPADRYERISEVEIMLAVGRTREESLAFSVNLLKELLVFFLGEPGCGDLRVESVASVRDGRIVWAKVDPSTIATPPNMPPDGVALLTADGRELRLTFELERIFSVRNAVGAGLRIKPILSEAFSDQPVGPDWRETLAFADLMKVDLATLGALEPLRSAIAAHKLIVPVSVQTVFSERGLTGVLSHLDGGEAAALGPLVEICGVDVGTPRARLEETVSMMKRYAKGVIARTTANRWQEEALRACRFSGLSMDCGAIRDKAKLQAALSSFGKAAHRIGPVSLALGLPTDGGCELAAAAGVSHASLKVPQDGARDRTPPDLSLANRPPALA